MFIRTPADLGAVIRDRRKKLDLDQAELAERIGVSRQWVVGIERGRARAELGLVLRTLDSLGIRLNSSPAGDGDASDLKATTSPDIDAIVDRARGVKP